MKLRARLPPPVSMTIDVEKDITATDTEKTVYLLKSHMRAKADDTRHSCPICLCQMTIRCGTHPAWAQCPNPKCSEVMHEQCLNSYVTKSSSDTVSCPNCKQSFAVPLGEEWSADDLIGSLRDALDEDFVVDLSGTSEQSKSNRVLRSMGAAQHMPRRL
eukprot:3876453-Prymnesium_polylepis.1